MPAPPSASSGAVANAWQPAPDTGVEIVEVGPRDGFQPIKPWIPTERKIDFVRRLAAVGFHRIEITSFVSDTAIPQLRDAADVLRAASDLAGLTAQVLVPTAKRGRQALDAGATTIGYVLSASEAHNRSNVRRSVADSIEDYRGFVAGLDRPVRLRLNLATTFDCPFTGRVAPETVLAALETLVPIREDVELCLCDTTGRADPAQVQALFADVIARFPHVTRWAFHGHDTYGLGCANSYAAYSAGVRVIDGAVGGLGGCPFAPGATGNTATEDLVWMFERMGVVTGIDLDGLVAIAADAAGIPGASAGGRTRTALEAARCLAPDTTTTDLPAVRPT